MNCPALSRYMYPFLPATAARPARQMSTPPFLAPPPPKKSTWQPEAKAGSWQGGREGKKGRDGDQSVATRARTREGDKGERASKTFGDEEEPASEQGRRQCQRPGRRALGRKRGRLGRRDGEVPEKHALATLARQVLLTPPNRDPKEVSQAKPVRTTFEDEARPGRPEDTHAVLPIPLRCPRASRPATGWI